MIILKLPSLVAKYRIRPSSRPAPARPSVVRPLVPRRPRGAAGRRPAKRAPSVERERHESTTSCCCREGKYWRVSNEVATEGRRHGGYGGMDDCDRRVWFRRSAWRLILDPRRSGGADAATEEGRPQRNVEFRRSPAEIDEGRCCGGWVHIRLLVRPSRSHLTRAPFRRRELSGHLSRNPQTATMQNENGENVDLYIPRKCSWTNRLIRAKDHGSVQINVANVDPATGLFTGEATAYALSGYVRDKAEGDMALTALIEANDKKAAASQE
ncbi:hypothetical protein ACHAWF_007736 [Thalassiosira exigua]